MRMSEEEYIQKINELQAEVDEDYELIEAANKRIKDLELALSLANSSFSKKETNNKRIQEYKDKIDELEECISLVSIEVMDTKANEIEDFLKKVLSIKKEFNELKQVQRLKKSAIKTFEDSLDKLALELANRLSVITKIIVTIDKDSEDIESLREYIEDLYEAINVYKSTITKLVNEAAELKKENKQLRDDIIKQDGSDKTKKELLDMIEAKDLEINALKDKIMRLEYQNS